MGAIAGLLVFAVLTAILIYLIEKDEEEDNNG